MARSCIRRPFRCRCPQGAAVARRRPRRRRLRLPRKQRPGLPPEGLLSPRRFLNRRSRSCSVRGWRASTAPPAGIGRGANTFRPWSSCAPPSGMRSSGSPSAGPGKRPKPPSVSPPGLTRAMRRSSRCFSSPLVSFSVAAVLGGPPLARMLRRDFVTYPLRRRFIIVLLAAALSALSAGRLLFAACRGPDGAVLSSRAFRVRTPAPDRLISRRAGRPRPRLHGGERRFLAVYRTRGRALRVDRGRPRASY
jgi:hypothetical protein